MVALTIKVHYIFDRRVMGNNVNWLPVNATGIWQTFLLCTIAKHPCWDILKTDASLPMPNQQLPYTIPSHFPQTRESVNASTGWNSGLTLTVEGILTQVGNQQHLDRMIGSYGNTRVDFNIQRNNAYLYHDEIYCYTFDMHLDMLSNCIMRPCSRIPSITANIK